MAQRTGRRHFRCGVVPAARCTPFSTVHALLAGFVLSLAGFLGDIHVSALKRDRGLKDCSSALPGHGGFLDRVDSLTFTAPLLLHGVRWFYT
ncbi:MAG: hypothetical protein FJX76_05365 [Armatimonadetes bacterium]|nr:hypothetical protein [Armatimonadota bacterium]